MKKGFKVFIIILIIIIGVISTGFIYLYFFRPSTRPAPPQSNTYAENSSIDFLEYAVKLTYGDIVIEDFFNITNGRLNGYPIVNSTDSKNCIINNETRLVSISLHNDVNVTLKNIDRSDLNIYLHDNSSLVVENCTFDELWLFDFSSAIIKNSSIDHIRVAPPFEVPGVYYYQTSLSIINNSTIYSLSITQGCDLFIKDSKIIAWWSIFIETFSPLTTVTGNIENSTLQGVRVKGYANLNFYGSILEELRVHDMARVTLNQSTITSYYGYGIVAYSGTTNIDEGMVTGTGYINNTRLINSAVSNPLLVSVTANNSAVVNINNFSCSVYLHDDSSAIIANLTDSSLIYTQFSTFHAILMDSSSLIIENANFHYSGYLYCYDNSEAILKDSELFSLDCDTTNSISINNCSISDVWTYSFYSNLATDNVYITNSTIDDLNVGGKDVVYIENSTVNRLGEGVIIYSGSLTLNSGGFSGTGNYMNSTVLVNTNILTSRFLGNIEINGTAQLTIQDYAYNHDILCLDNAELIGKNSTIDNIISRDSSTINVENCSIFEEIALFEDSILNITQSSYIDGIIAMGNSFASIEDANIYFIYVFESTRVTFDNSILEGIYVFASNTIDYALKGYNSTTTYLTTFTWGN